MLKAWPWGWRSHKPTGPGAEVHLTFVPKSLQHEVDISDPCPTHLEVLFPSTAFHMREQPCPQQCSQITQVKSEQGWGKPEVCTVPCFWFTASQDQKPLLGALCPVLCMAAILRKEAPTHFLTKNHEDPALFSKRWQQWQYLKPAHIAADRSWLFKSTDVFCEEPALLVYTRFPLETSIRSGPRPRYEITWFFDPSRD